MLMRMVGRWRRSGVGGFGGGGSLRNIVII
jgi:hypothetical protein